jgi:integrase
MEDLVKLTKMEEGVLLGADGNEEIPRYKRLIAQWEREVTLITSRQTSIRYGRALNTFLSYFPHKTDFTEFTRLDILEFKARRRKATVSARTVNYEVGVVRRFWDWLIVREEAVMNPTVEINSFTGKATTPRLKETRPAKHSLSEEAQKRVYDACLDDKERLLVGLGLSTGLRPATMAMLQKEHFDFERKMVNVPHMHLKSARALELPIRDRELEIIKTFPEGSLWGKWARNPNTISRKWNRICQRVGINLRGFKIARRSCATTLIRKGVPLPTVQQWLGHKNVTTTMEYITPATDSELHKVLELLPQ